MFGGGSGGHMGVPRRVFLLQGFRAATSEVGLVGVQATRTLLVGRGGRAGRLSRCSSREEGAGRPTSPLRVRLTHPGQLLLASGVGGHRGTLARRHSRKGQRQQPWQKPEWREPQHEGFKWEHGKDRCKISSVRSEGELRQEEQSPLLRSLMAN